MDAVLFALSGLSVLLPGWAAVTLLGPRDRPLGRLETASLAFPLGAALVTLALFGLGCLVSGGLLRGLVLALGLLFGAAALARARPWSRWPNTPLGRGAGLGLAGVAAQAVAVGALAWRGTLEWDGLVVWEMKAYLACLNGGQTPLAYFTDPSRQWSHPRYPLFVPLLETWLYGWLGRCDQRLAGLLFPLFYLAAVGLLFAGGVRLGQRLGPGVAAALLLFCVPQLVVGAGSAASGYADFPLAVFYLGAVVYLADYALTGEMGSLRLAVALAACLPWVKQEGLILALCFLVLAVGLLWQRRRARVGLVLAPSVLSLALLWTAFLTLRDVPPDSAFLPFTPATLLVNLDRVGPTLLAVRAEMLTPGGWGVLWPGLLVALLLLALRPGGPPVVLLALSIALPVVGYAAVYLFSAWTPYTLHITSSLPRLLSHVAPLAVLAVGLAMPERQSAPGA